MSERHVLVQAPSMNNDDVVRGATVVFVHGYGEHAGRYEEVASALETEGSRPVLWDLPGHGTQLPADGELPGLQNLHALIDSVLSDCDARAPIILFGHSLGGLIAASYAMRRPGRLAGLVLSSPVLGGWNAIEAFRDMDEIPSSMVRPHHLSKQEGFAAMYAADEKMYRGPLRRSALALGEEALELLDKKPDALASLLPTLWLHGSADRIAPAQCAHRGLQRLEMSDLTARLFPAGKHELFHDLEREEALNELLRFVARVAIQTQLLNKNGAHK